MQKHSKRKRILSLLLALAMVIGLAACGSGAPSASDAAGTEQSLPTSDPSGASITVPEEIETVAVLAPSLAETVIALGHGEQIVACDTTTRETVAGIPEDAAVLDMVNPDMEQLLAQKPDVLLVTNLSLYDQEAPYQPLIDAGVCVACVPTSDSIADIESDLAFVAAVFGENEKGDEMIGEMQAEIDRIAEIGKTITEKKKVYFEISAAPYLYSFGSGVFLNEMLELLGAENILAGEEGWLSLEEETVVSANPDVILTNVNYIENPTEEILSRAGWESIAAVQNGDVYYIDNMASSLPNQNIVKAMDAMAKAIYPEQYGG